MVEVVGAILAGGLSRRMGGGDKCLRRLGNNTVLGHVAERAGPQVARLILNANGDAARFDDYDLTVVPDVIEGYAGPLAGILTVMEWAQRAAPDCRWIASFPADAPFVPVDYVPRLLSTLQSDNAELACAASGGRTHPVCGLWDVCLIDDLRAALIGEGIKKIDIWTARYKLSVVTFDTVTVDPFFNINRQEDLDEAERLVGLDK